MYLDRIFILISQKAEAQRQTVPRRPYNKGGSIIFIFYRVFSSQNIEFMIKNCTSKYFTSLLKNFVIFFDKWSLDRLILLQGVPRWFIQWPTFFRIGAWNPFRWVLLDRKWSKTYFQVDSVNLPSPLPQHRMRKNIEKVCKKSTVLIWHSILKLFHYFKNFSKTIPRGATFRFFHFCYKV